jgi:Family of unknown function (DUF6328)
VRTESSTSRWPTSPASSPTSATPATGGEPPRPRADDAADDDREDPGERADRELIELLNELRVALPGVQVLFAFLLGIPFTQRFAQLDEVDRRVFFAAVVATALATICLMAPSAHHRLRFRSGVKEQLLHVANVLAIAGMVLLAFAITAVTYVITDEMYPGALPQVVAVVLAAAFAVVWFVLPRFFRREQTPPHLDRPGVPDSGRG